jgi:hypothetical protein
VDHWYGVDARAHSTDVTTRAGLAVWAIEEGPAAER